jgi:hypothetical protein
LSELNQDRKVVDEGRKERLKDVDAPLRDQIVQKLYQSLKEKNIGLTVSTMWSRGNANRSTWLERQKAYLASWDEHLIPSTEGPFDGSSQLHIPMPFIVAKTMHARFIQAIWQDPPLFTKARNEASLERVATVQDTMRYYLVDGANHNKGVESVVDRWVWDWVTSGSGLMKWRWDVTYTRFVDVDVVSEAGAPSLQEVDGVQKMLPTVKQVEKEVKRTQKCFDGPVLDLVDLEDLLIIGGGGDPDLADAVIQRQYMTASELWTLVDRKIFNVDAVEAIIDGGPDSRDGALGNEIKTQRAMNAGQAQLDTDTDLDRYEILEGYLKVDVDGSGINSDVIVWVHPRSRELLRATYLYRVSKTGERPFIKADFHLRKDQEYGTGIVEILYPLSKEMDAIHNMRIDFGLISVMPFGFYRASSGIDPETISLEPGALIPVDNPQADVYFPNLGNRTVFGMQEEQAIQNMVERLTSISDMSLGMLSQQGAARTATGARAVMGEMSSNLDVHLRRLNRGWKKALRYLLHMLQQRIPEGLSFRLSGDDGKDYWRTVRTQSEIAGDFDIEVSPNSATSNSAIQEEIATQILQMTSNPLDIQLGVITAAQRYESLKNWYQAKGVKDFGRYLNKPAAVTRVYTPEEEANRLLRGMEVPVTPEMDHEGFIAYVEHIKNDDMLLGQFNKEQTIQLEIQSRKHQQMLQALQQMAAQQANAQQMQMNAQMGQQAGAGQQVAPSPQQAPQAPTGAQ